MIEAAVMAGVVYAGAWLSLFGSMFWLNDLPRIGALAATDLVVAGWFLGAAWWLPRPRPRGLLSVGVFLTIRAILELRYFAGMLIASPPDPVGTRPGLDGILIGALVLTGFVMLGFWQIALGRWLIVSRTSATRG